MRDFGIEKIPRADTYSVDEASGWIVYLQDSGAAIRVSHEVTRNVVESDTSRAEKYRPTLNSTIDIYAWESICNLAFNLKIHRQSGLF